MYDIHCVIFNTSTEIALIATHPLDRNTVKFRSLFSEFYGSYFAEETYTWRLSLFTCQPQASLRDRSQKGKREFCKGTQGGGKGMWSI